LRQISRSLVQNTSSEYLKRIKQVFGSNASASLENEESSLKESLNDFYKPLQKRKTRKKNDRSLIRNLFYLENLWKDDELTVLYQHRLFLNDPKHKSKYFFYENLINLCTLMLLLFQDELFQQSFEANKRKCKLDKVLRLFVDAFSFEHNDVRKFYVQLIRYFACVEISSPATTKPFFFNVPEGSYQPKYDENFDLYHMLLALMKQENDFESEDAFLYLSVNHVSPIKFGRTVGMKFAVATMNTYMDAHAGFAQNVTTVAHDLFDNSHGGWNQKKKLTSEGMADFELLVKFFFQTHRMAYLHFFWYWYFEVNVTVVETLSPKPYDATIDKSRIPFSLESMLQKMNENLFPKRFLPVKSNFLTMNEEFFDVLEAKKEVTQYGKRQLYIDDFERFCDLVNKYYERLGDPKYIPYFSGDDCVEELNSSRKRLSYNLLGIFLEKNIVEIKDDELIDPRKIIFSRKDIESIRAKLSVF
jgi:hypothetical protein